MEESHKNIITHHNAVSISGLDGSAGEPHPLAEVDLTNKGTLIIGTLVYGTICIGVDP